ncbi:MAG TPA: EpsI family protein [Usitatibacter sp.]|jgi:exosortase B|nr:EpsI family protein [Usitatibacter sp.]
MSTVLEQRAAANDEPGRWRPWLAVAAGLVLLYVPTCFELARTLWRDDAYGHGPVMLAVCAWLVWRDRAVLADDRGERAPVSGGLLVAVGLLLYIVGRSQELALFEAASLLPVACGTLVVLRGWSAARRLAFALALLVFVVPVPGFILDAVTSPLKAAVSASVAALLHLFGYPIERAGVVLQMGDHQLLVADACSGMNSIYSLLALSLVYVHLTGPSPRGRLPLVLLGVVPIAIAANIVRVATLVLVSYSFGDDAAEGFLHGFAGILVFAVAVMLLIGWDRVVSRKLTPRNAPAPSGAHPGATSPGAGATTKNALTTAMILLTGFVGAAVAAPLLRPLPADTAAVDLERMLPAEFAGWRIDPAVVPVTPAPDVQANLKRIYTQIVSRTYVNDAGESMMLTVAYGGDQSDALKAHRQEACYAAQGFAIRGLEHSSMRIDGRTIPVTRMQAVRGARSEPVTYWLTMGNRVVLGRLERLRVQLESGVRGRMPDGMLVRVSSLSNDVNGAYAAQQSFMASAVAAMKPADAARLVGTR